jgi:hypothetical protein
MSHDTMSEEKVFARDLPEYRDFADRMALRSDDPFFRRLLLRRADEFWLAADRAKKRRTAWESEGPDTPKRGRQQRPPLMTCEFAEDFDRLSTDDQVVAACAHLVVAHDEIYPRAPVETNRGSHPSRVISQLPPVARLEHMLEIVERYVKSERAKLANRFLPLRLQRLYDAIGNTPKSAKDLGQSVRPAMTADAVKKCIRRILEILGAGAVVSIKGPGGGYVRPNR